jgi:hypothetical protein
LIISGHSNSGKSSFTRCLSMHANVDFLDFDREVLKSEANDVSEERAKDHVGLWSAFGEIYERGNAMPLISELTKRQKPILVDWPFNADDKAVRMVEAWKAVGIPAWWFHADSDAAGRSCARRPNAQWHLDNLGRHVASIKAHEKRLRRIYEKRWLMALDGKDQRPSHGDMLHQIMQIDPLSWAQALEGGTFCTCVHPAV